PAPGATPSPYTYPRNSLYALDLPGAGRHLGDRVPGIMAPGSIYFGETGHNLSGLFKQYWDEHGGLAQQGYPITEAFREVSDTDGKVYRVQYFERAVFEYHPENQAPFNVLLSQLGTFQYKKKYPNDAPNQQPNDSP